MYSPACLAGWGLPIMLIPSYYIATITCFAGLSWLLYARSQKGRSQAGVLAWLSLPFFMLCAIYTWFSLSNVEVDVRVIHARYGIMSIALTQTVILFVLSFLVRGKNGK